MAAVAAIAVAIAVVRRLLQRLKHPEQEGKAGARRSKVTLQRWKISRRRCVRANNVDVFAGNGALFSLIDIPLFFIEFFTLNTQGAKIQIGKLEIGLQ